MVITQDYTKGGIKVGGASWERLEMGGLRSKLGNGATESK